MTDLTDLTDVELDLAVARIVGNDENGIYISNTSGPMVIREFPEPMLNGVFIKQVPWRPSQGGAAAGEVLEWVMARYDEIWLAWADLNDQRAGRACGITIDQDRQVRGSGPTNAIALCRAVVALGEAG